MVTLLLKKNGCNLDSTVSGFDSFASDLCLVINLPFWFSSAGNLEAVIAFIYSRPNISVA